MKTKHYLLLNKLANLGLNVVKCMKIKVLDETVYLKMLNNKGIFNLISLKWGLIP